MNNNTKAISFWNFLRENTIEIPIIQRDYAQGRLGKENLRKNFLGDLKKALNNEPPYKDSEMKLDFVYGSTENGRLYPLDGQQRLTTLWLLHWYIALRAGMLNEENCAILRKFTYETRISSREFCKRLCDSDNFKLFDGGNIVGFITKQTWFYSAWKQDPTIQSMLRMLSGTKATDKKGEDIIDGIEELFACPSMCNIEGDKCSLIKMFMTYWEKLTDEKLPCPIVFYNQPLHDFGLSDDLYIKMNARGKQLTSFENFKADLIGYMITKRADEDTLENEQQKEWDLLLDSLGGIPIKFDTDWTDIFWSKRSKGIRDKDGKLVKSNQIDEIFFAFLNRFFWNELFIAKESNNSSKFLLDLGKSDDGTVQENENASYKYLNDSDNRNPNDYDTKIAYQGLDVYKYDNGGIPIKFFIKLQKVLNNYYKFSEKWTLPNCLWDSSFKFIPQYSEDENSDNIEIKNNANEKILRVSTLTQVQRIIFFAVCKYFDHDESIIDSEVSMKQWIRVVWNLVSGQSKDGRPQIRSAQAMRTAMVFIDELDSHNVYNSLSTYNKKLSESDFDERCKEEIAKAKQILDENGNIRKYNGSCEDGSSYQTWEDIIIEAEKYAFFKGSIRFLFQNETGEVDLNDSKAWNYEHFDIKLKNAKKYFDGNGVKNEHRVSLTKSLVIQCVNWNEQLFDKQIFNTNSATWEWILTAKNWTAPIHNILMGNEIYAAKENNDDNVKKYIAPLLDVLPFENMIDEVPEGRFMFHKGRLAYYYFRSKVIIFDWVDWYRNHILVDLLKRCLIKTTQQISNTNFFWGWSIQFIYNNKYFQWHRDGYVRMIEDLDNCEPIVKDDSKDNPESRWYCITPTQEMEYNTKLFIDALNSLMDQANNDEKFKSANVKTSM